MEASRSSWNPSSRLPTSLPKIKPAPGGSSGKGAYSIGGVITPYNTKITDCHFEYGPTTEYVYSAPCSPQPLGRNEIQKFAIGANAGDFRLLFRGQETGDIPLGVDPKVVEEELQALSAIGPQGVTKVVRGYGFFEINYEIFFGGPLSGTNLNPIKVINGNPPVFIEGQGIPGCCTGDSLGFAGIDRGRRKQRPGRRRSPPDRPHARRHLPLQTLRDQQRGHRHQRRHPLRRPARGWRKTMSERSASGSKTTPPAYRNAAPTSWSPPLSRPATGRAWGR